MIKTFIYGTPHGFNFYEKDDIYDNYFKGFYISSRRNRRLMVNRQANGVTTYNYLKYNLLEVEGRPHAFFGMSLVLDDYKFCPDFKEVLKWFDWLFDKIANEKSIFIRSEEGENISTGLKYAIHKFDECSKDIEWLKGVLPNIFSIQAKTSLQPIDSSFENGRTGQVIGLNDNEEDNLILEAFKKYTWVALAPEYQLLKNRSIEDVVADLDYGDLYRKLNECNSSLLPIAIDVSKANLPDLLAMQKSVNESIPNLVSFCKGVQDPNEAQRFFELQKSYLLLAENLSAVISKKTETEKHTQYCYSCKQNKDSSEFRDSASTKCISCESKEKRTCRECGVQKSLNHFTGDSDICNECKAKGPEVRRCHKCHRTLPLSKFASGSVVCEDCSKGYPSPSGLVKPFTIVVAALLIIGIVLLLFVLPHNSHNDQTGEQSSGTTTQTANGEYNIAGGKDKQIVNANELQYLIYSGTIKDVFDYLSDKSDKDQYYPDVKKMLDNEFWLLIDGAQVPFDKDVVNEKIIKLKIDNQDIISEIGYEFNAEYWTKLVSDYSKLSTYIQNNSLTDAQYNEGINIINRYPDRFDNTWLQLLQLNKPNRPASQSPITNDHIAAQNSSGRLNIVIKRFDADGTSEIDSNSYTDGNPLGVDGFIGQFVEIETSSGKIRFKAGTFEETRPTEKSVRIKLTAAGSKIYNVSGKQITITAKKKGFIKE